MAEKGVSGSARAQIFRGLFAVTSVVVAYLAFMQAPEAAPQHFMDKIHHAFAFYMLALLLDFSLPRNAFGLRKFLVLMAYGIAIECVQYFLPYRQFSVFDMLADAVGLLLYVASVPLLMRIPILQRRWRMN